MINSRVAAVEHIHTYNCRRIALEIHRCQFLTETKRTAANIGHAAWNCQTGQVGAVIKGTISYAGDAVGDHVASEAAFRIFKDRGFALIKQNSIHTGVRGVDSIHHYRTQISAAIERTNMLGMERSRRLVRAAGEVRVRRYRHGVSDAADAVWDYDVSQAGAATERICTDAGNAVWDCDIGQAGAATECICTNAGDAVWDYDIGQPVQPQNAFALMLVTLVLIVMPVKLEQL